MCQAFYDPRYGHQLGVTDSVPSVETSPSVHDSCSVELIHSGPMLLNVIKIIKDFTGHSLSETKQMVESAPIVILADISRSSASRIVSFLEEAGATARVINS
jgi:ribosomal protein L7/L12